MTRAWLAWAAALLACVLAGAHAEVPWHQRQSSSALLSPSTLAMQEDMGLNPASLWLADGQALWQEAPASAAPTCQGCHGDLSRMKGVANRFPRLGANGLINLDDQINQCRQQRQHAPAWPMESAPLLALSLALTTPSRGLPIEVPDDARLAAERAQGEQLYTQRMGQIQLSCAHCHDQRWGQKLAGVTIPQAHPTGYPIYRLEWQSVGSLERRMRNCMNAVRALPFPPAAQPWRQLELYLKWRARGMAIETPAVRP